MSNKLSQRMLQELAKKHLAQLAETPGIQALVLFSDDGQEVASHAVSTVAAGRLSAIGSSLAALGVALCAEAGLGDTQRTVVESSLGTVMIVRLGSTPAMSLALVADRKAVLGRLIWATQHSCDHLRTIVHELNAAPDRDTVARK